MIVQNKYQISKSQIEVWNWKKSIHEEIKDLRLEDGLKYIIDKANRNKEILFPTINKPIVTK